MKRASLVILVALLVSATAFAQAPAAGKAAPAMGGSKIAVIDFAQAVTGNGEGTKISNRINAEGTKRQADYETKRKKAEDLQEKLKTGDKLLSDAVKADYAKQIETLGTEMTRINEDWQRDLGDMQNTLFAPIAARVTDAVKAYAEENSIAVVFDRSGQGDNIVFALPAADITQDVILKVDAMPPLTNAAPKPTTTAPSAAPRPATTAPSAATPRPPAPSAAPPKAPATPDPAKKNP